MATTWLVVIDRLAPSFRRQGALKLLPCLYCNKDSAGKSKKTLGNKKIAGKSKIGWKIKNSRKNQQIAEKRKFA